MSGAASPAGSEAEARLRLVFELRQAGVTDARVLGVIETLPRHLFLPRHFRARAYENVALPIGHHQTISQPAVVGLMTQALQVGERMKVLEIGTGSGYQAAVLARLCRRLYTIERHRPLLEEAEGRFAELRLHNVTAMAGDGTLGWPDQAPFDRILVTAAALDVPGQLVDQLAVGGVMVLPVGFDQSDQRILRVTRTEDGCETADLGGVRFVPLVEGPGAN